MPNWEPNSQNVSWDWDTAEETAAALRRNADLLDQTTNERIQLAIKAKEQWRGQHRLKFDSEHEKITQRARELASKFRDAANRINRASHLAREEQHRRERERERWRREKEREIRQKQS